MEWQLQRKGQKQWLLLMMGSTLAVIVTLLCPGSIEAASTAKKKATLTMIAATHHEHIDDMPLGEEPLIDQIAMESVDTLSPPAAQNSYVSVLPPSPSYAGFKINPNCKCGVSPYANDSDKEGNPHPWTAAIFYEKPPTSRQKQSKSEQIVTDSKLLFCTGTLINDRYVLTASRCVQGLNATDLHVWLSEKGIFSDQSTRATSGRFGGRRQYNDDDEKNLKKISVEKIIIHPDFHPSKQDNEIALLRLKTPIKLSMMNGGDDDSRSNKADSTPICLPKYEIMERMKPKDNVDESYIDGMNGTVITWDKKGRTSYSLVEAQVPFVNGIEKCVEMTNKSAVLNENMLCAGKIENGVVSDSCSMDTGSPLVIYENEGSGISATNTKTKGHYTLVGVSSWLYGCTNLQNVNVIYDVIFPDNTAKPQVPGVYTKIEKYRDWISHNTLDAVWCA